MRFIMEPIPAAMISEDKSSHTIIPTIRQRYSCRTYTKASLAPETRRALSDFCAAQQVGPSGNRARFTLISAEEEDRAALKGLGTYGFIRNPTGFLLGAVEAGPYALEDFGYLLERMVLEATALGLGTCWLGGSFTKSRFAEKLALREDELLPAVVSVGYPADKRALIDRVVRSAARGDQRLPWEQLFFAGDFATPLPREAAGAYAEPLELVRLGPSASNKQPWRIVRGDAAWHFYLAHTPGYGRSMRMVTAIDLQRVDMGIAQCHFALVAEALGLPGRWTVHPPKLELPDALTEYSMSWMEG